MGDHPTRWMLSLTPAADIKGWMDLGADARSGTFPASYTSAAVLKVEGDLSQGGVAAVAYRLGSAAMVTQVDADARPSARSLEYPELAALDVTQVALRVGRGMLTGAVGAWYEDTQVFVSTSHEVTYLNGGQPVDMANVARQFPDAVIL